MAETKNKEVLQTKTFESSCSGQYGSHYKLKIIVTENSISTDNNKSSLHIKVTNQSEGSKWGNFGYANPTRIYINDVERAYNNPTTDYRNQREVTLCEWTGEISHNDNGEKEITVKAEFSSTSSHLSGGSVSGNIKLTTIPRASTVTANDSNIGSVSNIVITRASDSFTHTIKYNFGDLSGTIATKTNLTTIPFTVPDTFYSQIPNAKSGVCTITCETYNGNNLIGTKTTTFIATASEELCKPTLSASAVDINETTIALTGDNDKLVNGYSNAQVTYNASANNSATLKSVTVNGVSANSPYTINKIATGTITVVATDSRGYSTTVNINKTLVNYIPLSVNPNFYRTSPTTGQVSLSFSGNYFNNTFGQVANTLELTWSYRIKGQGNFIHGGILEKDKHYKISGNTFYSGNGSSQAPFIIGANFDYKTNYEFILYYIDKLVATGVQKTVPRGEYILGWNADKVRTNGTFEVNSENVSNIKLLIDNIEKGRLRANSSGSIVLGANNGYIYLRPNGFNDTNGELVIANSGNIYSNGGNIKKYWGSNNFDNALTEGYYNISGNNVAGAPYTGNIFGKLIVDVNDCTYYKGSNNWIWQRFINTSGQEYLRWRVNAWEWEDWRMITNCQSPNTIVEKGTTANGTYIKYADGRMECYGTVSMGNQAFTTDYWSSFNRSGNQDMHVTYPQEFKTVECCNISASAYTGWTVTQPNGTVQRTPGVCVVVPKGFTSTQEVKVSYHAYGTWK